MSSLRLSHASEHGRARGQPGAPVVRHYPVRPDWTVHRIDRVTPKQSPCRSAGTDRVCGLVLHCPFASFGSAAAFKSGGSTIVGKIASWGVGYDNIHKLLHTNLPLHVVYAANDTYVNPQDGVNLAAVNRGAAATTKQEYIGDHPQCDRIFNNVYTVGANTTGTLDNFVTGLPRT